MTRATYREAGVDIEAGDALVEMIKPLARATDRPGVVGGIGGFGALFDLRAAGFIDPILISATDGVGTKLKLAIDSGIHETIGIDLVAMCVNDLVVQGATPLFFLDYFATGKLDPAIGRAVIAGIAEGCRLVGCALTGGETAEMPGMYRPGDYDLAGFAVGAAERGTLLPHSVMPGDVVLGLPSSGFHSNGFSLVRQIINQAHINLADPAPFSNGETLAKALLTPTELYVGPVLALVRAGLLQAAAHITGGGLPGNLPRVLPQGCAAELDAPWPMPVSLRWLQSIGSIAPEEMLHVFNCGAGMVLVVRDAASAEALLRDAGHSPFRMGKIVETDEAPNVRIAQAHQLFA